MNSDESLLYRRYKKKGYKKSEKYMPSSGSYTAKLLSSVGNQTIQGFFNASSSLTGFNNISKDLSPDLIDPRGNTSAIQQKSLHTELSIQRHVSEFMEPRFGTDVDGTVLQMGCTINNTGMPDDLKAGIENLSGIDMSDVKVHYNSSMPGKINAHAHTQGSEIYVAPGKEKYLPHEAWHVVQQKEGRVKPTTLIAGLPVNDDPKLEKEADIMGSEALSSPGVKSGRKVGAIKPQNTGMASRISNDKIPTVQRLKYRGKEINVDELDYVTAHNYLATIHEHERNLKSGGKGYPGLEYSSYEYAVLRQRIREFEMGKMGEENPNLKIVKTIICSEGESKSARPGQDINFGSITSCMTITLTLDKGWKIAVHEGLEAHPRMGTAVAELDDWLKNGIPGARIKKIRAYGAGTFWTYDLKPVKDGKKDPLYPNCIDNGNEENLKAYLKEKLGSYLDGDDIKYELIDQSQIRVNAEGELFHIYDDIFDDVNEFIGVHNYSAKYGELLAYLIDKKRIH